MNDTPNTIPTTPIFCPSCAANVAESANSGSVLRCPICGTEFKYEPDRTAESTITQTETEPNSTSERRRSTEEILLDRLKNEPPEKKPIGLQKIAILFAVVLAIAYGVYQISLKPEKFAPSHEVDTTALLQKQLFYQHLIDSLRMQIVQNPKNIDLHLSLADDLYDVGQWEDSKKEFQTYLAIKPDDADARVDYSYAIAQDNGDLNAAIAEIDTALKYNPRHLNALINAGIMTAQTVSDTNHTTALAKAKDYFERAKAVAEKSDPDVARRIDTLIQAIDSTGLKMRMK